MRRALSFFAPIKAWQAALLVVVLTGSGVGSFAVVRSLDSTSTYALADNQQLVRVQRGDLVDSVSINGNIVFPVREALTFGVAGTVGDVLVQELDRVVEGQALAVLDKTTLNALEEGVASARVALDSAEEALIPPGTVEITEADAEVAKAHVALQEAWDDLAAGLEPFTQLEIKSQLEAIAQAQADLQTQKDALVSAKVPFTQLEIKSQLEAVAQARADLQTRKDALVSAQAPFTLQDLRDQEELIASARVSEDQAREDLAVLQEPASAAAIATAEAAIEAAKSSRDAADVGLLEAENNQEDLVAATSDALADARLSYREALFVAGIDIILEGEDFFLDPQAIKNRFVPTANLTADTFSAWVKLTDKRDEFTAATAKQAVVSAERTVVQTKEALLDAEEALAALIAPPGKLDLSLKEANLAAAKETRIQAEETLADMILGADALDVALKQARLETASTALATEEETLADMISGADALDVALMQARLDTAAAALVSAETDLQEMLEPSDAVLIAKLEVNIRVAEANLAEKEQEFIDLKAGLAPLVKALRDAELESARSALEMALADLSASVLRSPMNGVIDVLVIEAGDQVTRGFTAMEIVDSTVAELDGVIDEIDVLYLNVGAVADVTMDALLGQTLTGTVSSIDTRATASDNVVIFPVRIRVDAPAGFDFREGLSASASVVLKESTDVLLVPSAAIGGSFLQPTVLLEREGKIIEQRVTLGDGDDFNVVVAAGVNEGDAIVVETSGLGAGNIFGAAFGGGRGLRELFGAGQRGGQGGGTR